MLAIFENSNLVEIMSEGRAGIIFFRFVIRRSVIASVGSCVKACVRGCASAGPL